MTAVCRPQLAGQPWSGTPIPADRFHSNPSQVIVLLPSPPSFDARRQGRAIRALQSVIKLTSKQITVRPLPDGPCMLTPAMSDRVYNLLFLCTGNSARSILAEAVMNREAKGRFRGFSAGSRPTGAPNPFALALLQRERIDIGFARSKSWDEFAGEAATKVDFVFTV